MKSRPDPSEDQIHKAFWYDAEIGALYWKEKPKWAYRAAKLAGFIGDLGYWIIGLGRKQWKAHRLIWIYHHGPIPDGLQIDHINGNRSDNHIENLRLTTPMGNSQNVKVRTDNSSGVRGVHIAYPKKQRPEWRYQRQFNGRRIRKSFRTKAEAIVFALKTERSLQQFQTRQILPPIEEQQNGVG